jgi:hypothetical protein
VKVPEEYDSVVVDRYKALTIMSYLFPIKRGKTKGIECKINGRFKLLCSIKNNNNFFF